MIVFIKGDVISFNSINNYISRISTTQGKTHELRTRHTGNITL
jgi:hypothetical protein